MKTTTLAREQLIELFTENLNNQIKLSGSLIIHGPELNLMLNSTACKTVKATVGWMSVGAPRGKGRDSKYRVRVINIIKPTYRQIARSMRVSLRK